MQDDDSAVRREELSSLERLGLRISEMINSPLSQLGRRVLINRLDTDTDQDWNAIMELLNETEGLHLIGNSDGSLLLSWDLPTDDDCFIHSIEDVQEIGHSVSTRSRLRRC